MRAIVMSILASTACVAGGDGAYGPTQLPSGGGGGGQAALLGSWYAGAGGVSAPYDPATGTFGMPNGQGLVYVLRADGTYTKAFQSYASNGGCTTGFTAFEAGAYVADASSLRTAPSSGQIQYRDTCAPSLNSDKPATELAAEQFQIQLSADQLTLVRSDGATGTFRRIGS